MYHSNMKFAIIQSGGKQFCINGKDIITIEVFTGCKEGDTVTFDKVLLFDDGSKTDIGIPYIKDRKITGVIEKVGRKKKISVMRFRSKSNYRRHYGHRQPFCRVRINELV